MSVSGDRPWFKNYVHGILHEIPSLPYRNVDEIATHVAKKWGNKTAFSLCMPNGMCASLTYKEVDALASKFAAYLRSDLGLEPGDRVALQMPNCLSYAVAVFGVFRAGCVVVNVNPLYTSKEMEHQLRDSGAKAIVIIDMFTDKLAPILAATDLRAVITTSLGEFFPLPLKLLIQLKLKLEKKIPTTNFSCLSFGTALRLGALKDGPQQPWRQAEPYKNRSPNEIAVLQYTGGTTGVAKGAMLTHGNLLSNMMQIQAYGTNFLKDGENVIFTALPLYHIFAFTVNLLVFFKNGAHNILIPSPRPMSNLKKVFAKFKPDWFTGVNTLFAALLNEKWFAENPPTTIRVSVAGGMALHEAVALRWKEVTKTPVFEGYGLTESSPVLCFNPLGGQSVPNTIGLPIPSTDIRLVDDDGKDVPPGAPGELIARGPQIMLGYWNMPEESAKTLKNGWLYTGDIAVMDEGGYFKIVDRKKEMILVSGFNVYPNEVEDVIAKHENVLEVGVIGIPDEQAGEVVKAFVVLKDPNAGPSAEELRGFCRKALTGYKVPRHVEFRKELPKSPIGKILRKDLRAESLGTPKK